MQNKLLFVVTGQTAAELITRRADADQPNMGLTAWKGGIVRKQDITIAKNYLNEDEIDTLNRLVVIFLETAELRAKQRRMITMDFWRASADQLISSNGFALLDGAGSVSNEAMKALAAETYERFDQRRKSVAAKEADALDEAELKALERKVKRRPGA